MNRWLVSSVLAMALPACACAEQILLQDGTVVKGELVDFSNGTYTVKVGKFLKTIPENRITDVRPDSAAIAPASATPLPPPGASAPHVGSGSTPISRPAPPPGLPMAQPMYGGNAGGPPGGPPAGLPSGLPAGLPPGLTQGLQGLGGGQLFPGGGGGANVSPQQIQDALKRFGGNDPGVASAVQSMMSGGGIDMGQLQQLQNNPAMQKMVERFRDPAYQRQLLEGLSEIQGQQSGGQHNPMMDQLQGLFQQLNTLQGQQGHQ